MKAPHTSTRSSVGLFLLVLGVYLLCSPAHFLTTQDEELNLRSTLSLLEGQKGAIPPVMGGFASKRGIDGKEYAQYGLGVPVAYAAWCYLGLQIDPSPNTLANYLANVDSFNMAGTPFLRWWMTVFTMMLTSLTVVLIAWILLYLGLNPAVSYALALLLAFGTYMMPHGRTLFSEPLTAFGLTGALYMLLRFREQPSEIKFAGFAGCSWAYAVFTRLDTLVTLPAAVWLMCIEQKRASFRFKIQPQALLSFVMPFVAVMIVILLYNRFRFDSFFSTGYEDQTENIRFATPLLVGLHGFFFTPGRSLFLYSPALIFFPWGFMRLYKKNAWFAVGLGILCGMFLCVMSKWQNWAGGWDWGPRHIYQLTPLLFIMAAMVFQRQTLWDAAWKKAGWVLLIVLSVSIQFLGLAADPVQTTAQLLERFASPYPENMQGPIRAFAQQFMVYLPQFSSPVLHGQALFNEGVDLLLVQSMQVSFLRAAWFFIPLGMAGCGFCLLWPSLSGKKECDSTSRITAR